MKRLILLILFLVPNYSWGQEQFTRMTPNMLGSSAGTAAAACATLAEETTGTFLGDSFCRSDSADWYAAQFYTDATKTICKIILPFKSVGSPTMSVTAYIYSDSSDSPSTVVAGDCTSDAVDMTGLPVGETEKTFPNMSCSISTATHYWIVLKCSAIDTDNYIQVGTIATPVAGWSADPHDLVKFSADGSSWTSDYTTRTLKRKMYE